MHKAQVLQEHQVYVSCSHDKQIQTARFMVLSALHRLRRQQQVQTGAVEVDRKPASVGLYIVGACT